MHKKAKIFIILFFIFIFHLFFQTTYAKYVLDDVNIVAKINIDRCKPNIELLDITSSNSNYPTYANETHLITGHIKIIEKNIVRNDFSKNQLKVTVDHHMITPEFKSFTLISENSTEKIYEFSFIHATTDGSLGLVVPKGIVEDRSRFN